MILADCFISLNLAKPIVNEFVGKTFINYIATAIESLVDTVICVPIVSWLRIKGGVHCGVRDDNSLLNTK